MFSYWDTPWEAAFYVVYFKAMECTVAQIHSAAISVNNCEDSVLALIRDYVPEANQKDAVAEVVMRSMQIAYILAGGAKRYYEETAPDIRSKYVREYIDRVLAAKDILYTCGTQIESIWGNQKDIMLYAVNAWEAGIDLHTNILPHLYDKSGNREIIVSYAKKIMEYDPAYAKQCIKDQLESEIAALKKAIADASAGQEWGGIWVALICIGVLILFMLICICFSIEDSSSIGSCLVAMCLIPLPLIAFGIYRGYHGKPTTEYYSKMANEAKEQLAKKEAELKELME